MSEDKISRAEVIKMISEAMQRTGSYIDLCRRLDAVLKDLESGRG